MKDQKKIPTSIASQLILYHTKKGNMKESLSYLHNMISPQFKPSIKMFVYSFLYSNLIDLN